MGGGLLLAAAIGCLALFGWLGAGAIGMTAVAMRGLSAYVLAWSGLVVAAVALSVPGELSRWTITAALAALAAIAVLWRLRQGPQPGVSSVVPACREALGDPVVRTLAVAVAVAGVYLAAVAFLTTPNDWDGLTYHETRALLWDQHGRVGYVPSGNDPRLDGNPPVSEIGLYLATLVPRSERFGAAPQYAALWASLVAVVLLGRRLGLSRRAAAYGGLVFASLPIVLLQGAALLNDLVVASFLLGAVVLLSGRRRAELALGSLALGLALSTKFNAVLALPLVVAVPLSLAPTGRRLASAVACGAGALLGTPWYVVNLVETDQLWGHRNDPVNFHRCLQDFDRRLSDILDALHDGDLLVLTSDHGCDPTTPSTDHSREYALLLAYAAGKNAAGRIHEDGEFGDVGATVCAWLGAKHPGKGAPGRPIVER